MKKILYSLFAVVTMMCAMESSAQTVSGNKNGHDYVDLGLPSGRLWATCNVGASKPTEYGDYFAWGETSPKGNYHWSTYKWCKGSYDSQTKYCENSKFGAVDSLTTLLAKDDAATANWGTGWRMPTLEEQKELIDGCNWKWTKNFNGSGIAGRIGTSKTNGRSIFLPAAGYRNGTDLFVAGVGSFYWSSSLSEYYSYCACYLHFTSDYIDWDDSIRYCGHSVRAIVK